MLATRRNPWIGFSGKGLTVLATLRCQITCNIKECFELSSLWLRHLYVYQCPNTCFSALFWENPLFYLLKKIDKKLESYAHGGSKCSNPNQWFVHKNVADRQPGKIFLFIWDCAICSPSYKELVAFWSVVDLLRAFLPGSLYQVVITHYILFCLFCLCCNVDACVSDFNPPPQWAEEDLKICHHGPVIFSSLFLSPFLSVIPFLSLVFWYSIRE